MKIKFDLQTSRWFQEHPHEETTVAMCDYCGEFYKPNLGHSCKAGFEAREEKSYLIDKLNKVQEEYKELIKKQTKYWFYNSDGKRITTEPLYTDITKKIIEKEHELKDITLHIRKLNKEIKVNKYD